MTMKQAILIGCKVNTKKAGRGVVVITPLLVLFRRTIDQRTRIESSRETIERVQLDRRKTNLRLKNRDSSATRMIRSGAVGTVLLLVAFSPVGGAGDEQRNAQGRSPATVGLGFGRPNGQALEGQLREGTAVIRNEEVRSGSVAGNKHALIGSSLWDWHLTKSSATQVNGE
jgi:hypothetical protein